MDQVVDAVARVHAANGRYLDVKPSNCLVDYDGALWLSDFGLGRLLGPWGDLRLGDGLLAPVEVEAMGGYPDVQVGSQGYLSPEQWAGRRDVDRRADVFLLGATIYHGLTLELPYSMGPIGVNKMRALAPSRRQPLLPADLDAVILQALEPQRQRRFASAVEMQEAWQRIRGTTVTLPKPGYIQPAPRPAAESGSTILEAASGLVRSWWNR
jgi:serine/threonine protein kinase